MKKDKVFKLISFQDRNDETPQFVLDLYSGSVRENAKPGLLFSIFNVFTISKVI